MGAREYVGGTWQRTARTYNGGSGYRAPSEVQDKTITETFNQYFLNVGVKLAAKIKPSDVKYSTFLSAELKSSVYF